MLISRLAQFFPNCKDYIAPIYIGRKTLLLFTPFTATRFAMHTKCIFNAFWRLQVSQNCISCNFDFAEYGL